MKLCRYLIVGLLAILLGGCGQTVKESLKMQGEGSKSSVGEGKTLVIMPFADYSFADDLDTAFRRQMFINENLVDELVSHNFKMPVLEDVFQYLAKQNVISIESYTQSSTSSLENELRTSQWSPEMREELGREIALAKNNTNRPVLGAPGTHGLAKSELIKIGRYFSADYILRGRITQYNSRQEGTWAPWKRGILPFLFGTTSQITFGQASSSKYDNWDDIVIGGGLGNLYGTTRAENDILGVSDGNAILWTGLGAGLGHLANKGGDIPQAVVQLRIWVQDSFSGDVVWTNRIDVRVSPETVLADYQYDDLFQAATEKAVSTLINDFATQL
ncbi:MAG: hypothetical protein OEM02_04485 [Desulfobulbaceae bacterium]|nr:hypothetical protein [Desulfobulbaceae bacterium]